MSRDVDALRAMWPAGIPVAEYERAARLVRTLGAVAAPPAQPPQRSQPPRRKKRAGTTVGDETLARVREMLATGPATARDLEASTGIEMSCVYAALRQIGAVVVGKAHRVDGRSGLQPSLYALGETP